MLKDFWIGKLLVFEEKTECLEFYTHHRTTDGFVYILEGEGYFTDSHKNRIPISGGTIAILRRGLRYGFHFKERCRYVTTAFDICQDDTAIGASISDWWGVYTCRHDVKEQVLSILELWRSTHEGARAQLRLELCRMYATLYNSTDHPGTVSRDKDVDKVLAFIRGNYRKGFTAEDIARHCSMSESYLRAKFKRALGCGFVEYRERLRVQDAQRMLESDFFTIEQIAERLGYADVYHFGKRFKEQTGVSPGRYKKSFCTKK